MSETAIPIQQQLTSPKRKMSMSNLIKKHFWGYVFLLPALAVFILFLWVPIVRSFVYSFQYVDVIKGNNFIGFANYKTIFKDPEVLVAVKNTFIYMGWGLVIGFWVPIFFAIAISELFAECSSCYCDLWSMEISI
jgi:multiple sugar transport system permease protein